jgi:hypothetical protein
MDVKGVLKLDLNGDIDTGREIEFLQLINRARRGIDDIEKTLVCAHLKLIGRLLIHVR